ncbi:MAG: hypothetical protein U0840_07645 [Gemmataceae bacterium]
MRDGFASSVGNHPLWLLALAVLLVGQAWQTLALFDADRDGARLLNDAPVLSGRHPLHLYHGYLGAGTLLDRGSLSCYDPAYHAGYPKTPVFDPSSRPAELALALAGGRYSPAAYKICLGVICLLVPLLLHVAARGAGLSRGCSVLAALLGMAVLWGKQGRDALEAGDIDLLLGALLLITQAGMLVHYHHVPGIVGLLGVVLSGLLAWFVHPLLALLLFPLFLVYYFTVGHRHRPMWHIPLLAGLLLSVGGNSFWMGELIDHWWIRVPPLRDTQLVKSHGSLAEWWDAPAWGQGLDRGLACVLLIAGVLGVHVLHRCGRRASALLFGLGALGLFLLTLAGMGWEPFARLGSNHLLGPALLFATLPAAALAGGLLHRLHEWSGSVGAPIFVVCSVPALIALAFPEAARSYVERLTRPRPLEIGLSEEQQRLVDQLKEHTSPLGRILWEDRNNRAGDSHWTALLSHLTERAFVGGLDAEAGIEHASTGLIDGVLAGRPLSDWSDADLEAYCRKYNIAWIVCWSASARERLGRWLRSSEEVALPRVGEQNLVLYSPPRTPNFALAGSVRWQAADSRGILLADAIPQKIANETDGQVVLSLHYQAGMRVRPTRVKIERAVDSEDTIPFVRLRMSEPVGRILITWEGR